jgi:hypothetical protein
MARASTGGFHNEPTSDPIRRRVAGFFTLIQVRTRPER